MKNSYVAAGESEAVGEGPINRARTLRDMALSGWAVREHQGLEHGFTLVRPPWGTTAHGSRLEFYLTLRDDVRPEVSTDGLSLRFVDRRGKTKLTYIGLRVRDAQGRKLPTRFDARPQGVNLLVETTGARYPVTIDPVEQQAHLQKEDRGVEALIGHRVAISGDTVVVGAPGEAGRPVGIRFLDLRQGGRASPLTRQETLAGS
ncbi:MAG: hypothetical protein ABI540_09255 [Spartobacteria bacterium]